MTPRSLAIGLAIVIVQTMVLFWLSRWLLLGYVLRTLASHSSGRHGRRLISLLRLPGNLLHEASHAAAYLLSGYRISAFATCFSDPEQRGYVEAGRPWSPLHWGPLSAALSCAAPIVVGALTIRGLASALGVPLPAADVTAEGVQPVVARTVADVYALLMHLDWSAWQTYVFWYLAFTIGAELAPSGSDLRQGCLVLCALVLLFVLGLFALPRADLPPERAQAICAGVQWLLSALSTALFAGLIGCGLVGMVGGVLAWAIGRPSRPR